MAWVKLRVWIANDSTKITISRDAVIFNGQLTTNNPDRSQTMTTATQRDASSLSGFDELPDDAHVRVPVVAKLYGCSERTIKRHVASGAVPAPKKLSARLLMWRVGDLRAALASK
jgi:prophage regulatory protein